MIKHGPHPVLEFLTEASMIGERSMSSARLAAMTLEELRTDVAAHRAWFAKQLGSEPGRGAEYERLLVDEALMRANSVRHAETELLLRELEAEA